MVGAIVGDIVGSVYEFDPIETVDFPLLTERSFFTDDTVLTVAVAEAILERRDYGAAIREYALRYPSHSYGTMFRSWMEAAEPRPYQSFGNGSAMRVSPVAYAFDSEDDVLAEAERSAAVTHDHPEGIKGAQATALAAFRARRGASKEALRDEIADRFGYDLARSLEQIRPGYGFDETCQGTVPEAILCVLEAGSYEEAIRNAVSLGGDADTLAAIAGGIAEAWWGVPAAIEAEALGRLPAELRAVVDRFRERFGG